MRNFQKHLAITALIAAAGTALAQTAYTDDDPQNSPQTGADAQKGEHILHFRDQGNSPETDPAAHLLLIKDVQPMRTAVIGTTQRTTTVADATPAPAPAPAPADTATSADTPATPAIDTAPEKSSADDGSTLPAPRADRN